MGMRGGASARKERPCGKRRARAASGPLAARNAFVEPIGLDLAPWLALYEERSLQETAALEAKAERRARVRKLSRRRLAAVRAASDPALMERLRADLREGVEGAERAVDDAETEIERQLVAQAVRSILSAICDRDWTPYRACHNGKVRRRVDRVLAAEERTCKHAERRARDRRRIEVGYELHFPREHAGVMVGPLVARGFRSRDLHSHVRRFIQLVPRRGRTRCGDNKAVLGRADSKLQALDAPYVETNKVVRAILTVDLDRIFPGGPHEAVDAIMACGAPIAPHLLVGRDDQHGLHRPHAIWFLDHDAAVFWGGHSHVRAMFRSVHARLVHLLAPAGSDPGILASGGLRPKNPVSPLWSTFVPNENIFMTLSELAATLPPAPRKSLARQVAAATLLDEEVSNRLWTDCWSAALATLAAWHEADDPAFAAALVDRPVLAGMLESALAPIVARHAAGAPGAVDDGSKRSKRGAAYVASCVAATVAERHDPVRRVRIVDRGRMADDLADTPASLRQAKAGAFVAAARKERSIVALVHARVAMLGTGREDRKEAVAKAAGVGRSTAYALWAEVVERCGTPLPVAARGEVDAGIVAVAGRKLLSPADFLVNPEAFEAAYDGHDDYPPLASPSWWVLDDARDEADEEEDEEDRIGLVRLVLASRGRTRKGPANNRRAQPCVGGDSG